MRWGFFMDHLLDLLFVGSVVIAYSFLVQVWWLRFLFLVLLLVTCASMAVSFLSFAATNRFRSPTTASAPPRSGSATWP